MFNKYEYTILTAVLLLVLIPNTLSCDAKQKKSQTIKRSKIFWQSSFMEKELKVIPGYVKIAAGKFEFRWIINPDGVAELETLEFSSAGELPPRDKNLFLLAGDGGTTLLFQEWPPLLNVKEPCVIRPIVKVSTKELFSVLPKKKTPPVSNIDQQAQPIVWGKKYNKKGVQYLPGSLKASFGTLNIYWKKEVEHTPELIAFEAAGGGELPPKELKLYLWMNEGTGNTVIFQKRYFQLNQGSASYLWPLALVRTEDLMAGFALINNE